MSDSEVDSLTRFHQDHAFGQAVLRKVTWRLIPFLVLLYIFNILDRGNVGFARLKMQGDLNLSEKVFDFGYGIFYLGYLAFEVPSNILLRRFGARKWIARIMISWGLISTATMFVTEMWSFYAVRILLGVAEAGFFPGIILYLTFWFPARERARITALFMAAIPFAGAFGNALSGSIMEYLNGVAGLTGWQWIFLCEGVPSILLGFTVFFLLSDGPRDARWLSETERSWLIARLEKEHLHRDERHVSDLFAALVNGRVWFLICVYFTVAVGANAAGAYFPRLIQTQYPEASTATIGLLAALPYLCAIPAMTLLGAHSDRTGERRRHVAFALAAAAAGWKLSALELSPGITLAGLCLAQMGMMSVFPCFWAIPPSFLRGAAAAAGIALINSVANIGGWFGPNLLGLLGQQFVAGLLLGGALLALFIPRERDASY